MHGDVLPQTGTTIRGYRIERLLGTGGAGAVYEARRLGPHGPGERVACKVLHTAKRDRPWHREQARREAVLGLRITAGHPNLVEVLDFFDDGQARHCIVMELVDGTSVYELREPDRRLPFPVTRRIAVEVLEALAYLHGQGVLHRDLSLSNILVAAGGGVKVADLGGARLMEQGKVHTETIQATAMYAAREAIELLPLDVRSDLFSLGAILYDLVAGVPPCGDESLTARMIARNAAGHFAPLPPHTPADLAELITGLIRPDRSERRPETAAAALALLRDARRGGRAGARRGGSCGAPACDGRGSRPGGRDNSRARDGVLARSRQRRHGPWPGPRTSLHDKARGGHDGDRCVRARDLVS